MGRDRERAQSVLQDYVDEFGRLSSAAIDLPAAIEHHRSFREAYDATAFKFGSYATSTQAICDADLVVNATPLGMQAGDPAPFDTALFQPGQRAFDVVYGHGETAFVAGARAAGCTVSDGAGMLVAQAVASVRTVCDIAGVDVDLDAVDMFAVMADAAGF